MKTPLSSFNIPPGRILSGKYEVISLLGAGWEGEVYKVREKLTGIERAVKLFFPHRDKGGKNLKWYAQKLHKLKDCPIVIQYQTQDHWRFRGEPIPYLVSEYVEGELLANVIKKRPGKRFTVYEGLHLLYNLAVGMEAVHLLKEYHGDLHTENIFVCRQGLQFDLKVIDFYRWSTPNRENINDDICDLVKIFYESIGGKKHYRDQPKVVKEICCGLRRKLILKKFRTAGQLRYYLEHVEL